MSVYFWWVPHLNNSKKCTSSGCIKRAVYFQWVPDVLLVGSSALLVGVQHTKVQEVHFWWVHDLLLVGVWCTLGGCVMYFWWVRDVLLVGVSCPSGGCVVYFRWVSVYFSWVCRVLMVVACCEWWVHF